METLWQDLRYGFRMLWKRPGFTVVAVLTLALGIGANTAIFSVVNAVLLKPLPFKDPARLVAVESLGKQEGKYQTAPASPGDFWDWKEQCQAFEQIAAYTGTGISLNDSEHPDAFSGSRVSFNFFQTLGVEPLLGRAFSSEDGNRTRPVPSS